MASLTKVYMDGSSTRVAFYAARNCTTGDVYDASETFSTLDLAIYANATKSYICTIGTDPMTTITWPADLNSDDGWLMVFGGAAAS